MAPKRKTTGRILKKPAAAAQTSGPAKRPSKVSAKHSAKSAKSVLKRPAGAAVKRPAAAGKKPKETVASITERLEEVNWVPLESNPEMFTLFARHIGLPEDWLFVDVLGVDAELLTEAMVPRPCVAVTLLFEYSDSMVKAQLAEHKRIKALGPPKQDVFYMKQYVGNACGTIAAIHCVANAAKTVGIADSSPIGEFIARTQGQSPKEIGAALADMEDFHEASEECAAGGQTEAPEADDDTNHHFICFVERGGHVIQLDGAKPHAVDHGPAGDDFLSAATRAIKKSYMDKDPENIQFNMMALVKSQEPTLPTTDQ